jgi:hypothetical protein
VRRRLSKSTVGWIGRKFDLADLIFVFEQLFLVVGHSSREAAFGKFICYGWDRE